MFQKSSYEVFQDSSLNANSFEVSLSNSLDLGRFFAAVNTERFRSGVGLLYWEVLKSPTYEIREVANMTRNPKMQRVV